MAKFPTAVDGYYKNVPATHKATILEMRTRILEVIPDAEEIMKYGMPTFVIDGIAFAGLLANKAHIGYYPYSGSILNEFPELLEKYKSTKGSLHIPLDKPLSKTAVRNLIKARLKLGK